jgi:7,8-dihydropterin-6-yl-methyl-4-(beta-D-ribofuranosyl)aminobenzene 5'-phosphate synthase
MEADLSWETTAMACAEVHIRVVVDNQGFAGLAEEHGFAVWIEVSGHRILFDTGQGQALVPNAALLGCDLSLVETLVLSHGHYDHSGAVAALLQIAPAARILCHDGVFVPRYSVRPGEAPRFIAMAEPAKETILTLPPRQVHRLFGPQMITADVGISGPIPRVHPLEDTGGPFFLDPDGRCADPLEDDLALWIATDRGLIIVTGCCHAGLINTVEHIRAVSGVERLFGIIGGLHLANAAHDRLKATCAALRAWQPEFIVPCHCTGKGATVVLGEALGGTVVPGYAGLALTLAAGQGLSWR